MRILAVDDEKDALEVLVAAICECEKDAEIKAFNSPTEALNYAAENPPDIAFLDIRMPTMSGLDLAKKLPNMTEDEQFALLATDGMLVKRPLVVGDGFVLVGLKESEWQEKLL